MGSNMTAHTPIHVDSPYRPPHIADEEDTEVFTANAIILGLMTVAVCFVFALYNMEQTGERRIDEAKKQLLREAIRAYLGNPTYILHPPTA